MLRPAGSAIQTPGREPKMTLHDTAMGTVEVLEWGGETGGGTDRDREVMVLLHAAASGPRALTTLAESLVRPGRLILAPGLAGYGGTGLPEGDRVTAHVAVARWTLDNWPARRRILFGHSMGGLTALLAAAGRRDVDALVLFEPIVIAALSVDDDEDRRLRERDEALIRGFVGCVADGDPEAGVSAFVEAWNEVRWQDLSPKLRDRLVADAARLSAETVAVTGRKIGPDFWASMTAPTTILHGDRSPPLAARMARRLADRLPHARTETLRGLGHMGPATSPVPVAEAIDTASCPQ